jgi:hypothetical protein
MRKEIGREGDFANGEIYLSRDCGLGLLESRVQDSIRSIVLNSITVLH